MGGAVSDGDISEDGMGDDPTVDEDFFGDDEMEDDPSDEEDFFDNGVEEEDGDEDDDSDDEIIRPARHLRNVVGSDDDGEVTARAAHPPGTMAVFDELAPGDIDNPCEFQIKTL